MMLAVLLALCLAVVTVSFLCSLTNGQADWRSHVRPVIKIHARASLTQLLAAFLENKDIAAIVQSDDGSHIGWITLDDVTETLMGSR